MLEVTLKEEVELINLNNAPLPMTITLLSTLSGASRNLELSTIDTENFFTPQFEISDSKMMVLTILAPVVTLRVTAGIGDTVMVRD